MKLLSIAIEKGSGVNLDEDDVDSLILSVDFWKFSFSWWLGKK